LDYARERGIPKTRALRELVLEGVRRWRLKRALNLYREGRVSLWRAARMAGVPLSRMIEIAASERLPVHYGVEDLERDFKAVFG